jgi:hypothetical protein
MRLIWNSFGSRTSMMRNGSPLSRRCFNSTEVMSRPFAEESIEACSGAAGWMPQNCS